MRYALAAEGLEPLRPPGERAGIVALFDSSRGCEKFAQRLLAFPAGSSEARSEPDADELLYVLAGSASVRLDGEQARLAQGTGLFLAAGTSWSLDCAGPLELLSVLVRSPAPAGASHALVDLAAAGRSEATAARQFTLGVRPETGCASATQFIGYVPPGRAPDHYHHYDEVIYILAGSGVLHVAGEQAPLEPGVCVHLPARLVHCLENSGAEELALLGVFSPGGSPAEAYYPDGRPAVHPEER